MHDIINSDTPVIKTCLKLVATSTINKRLSQTNILVAF